MTTEEMMKQVTNEDISYYGEERIKKYIILGKEV